ncbi:MAG: 50S ribosomal protein L25 [Candidatus Binatota bacterium]|nr:50S ribosomal protein L25 [Candidatus Binatota bacterium]
MDTLEIQVEARDKQRKRDARRLLRDGKIPAILYGPKMTSVNLALDKKEFSRRVAGLQGSHLVRLKSASATLAEKVALVKDMQFHPISGDVIHADFYEVDLSAKIQVHVPLHFVGKAVGVVNGGVLQPILREIEVECLPLDIPEFFNVDVTALDIGDSVHLEDLQMPDGVVSVAEDNLALVAVVPPTVEAVETTTAEPVEGAAVAPVDAKADAKKDTP